MIGVAVLGSTGSIGVSTLNVVDRHRDRFRVVALTAHRSVEALAGQVHDHRPEVVVLSDGDDAAWGSDVPADWARGRQALLEVVERPDVDVVVNALVGFAGLEPTLRALRAGKRVALANKESLVVGGDLVHDALRSGGGALVPVDSEHSAILQCIEGPGLEAVARIVLTASGGPFRGWDPARLAGVGPDDALRHPTWDMGAKISIDSATLANKALEVIEAHVLYDMPYDRIDVVVHPQSIIHSFVEMIDGSVMAQLGFPTMELPILYALAYPERIADAELRTFDPVRSSPLTFEEVDRHAFPLFGLGVDAGRRGGTAPAVFNAANEVAVGGFLEERLSFPAMADAVAEALSEAAPCDVRRVEDVEEADRAAREVVRARIARSSPRATPTRTGPGR